MALPPDLRVLCRRLASTAPEDLPRICPTLVGHVLRCAGSLSAPQDAKSKYKSSEAAILVHKLRTQINTLLHGKTPSGRFAAIVLVKSVVDVGGWECLRESESWVRGLLAVLKKPDSVAAKELCVITLVRIYSLLHPYQTLVGKIVNPTLPSLVTDCLQLVKPAVGRPLKVPLSFVDTVISAFSRLVPLFPNLVRPSSGQIRSVLRNYIVPTSSDPIVVPAGLKQSACRLLVSLHHTAPKNGSSVAWESGIRNHLGECHATANQIFRAVQESWESTTGYLLPSVSLDGEPSGGSSDAAEGLPFWQGVPAGAERLVGLLELLGCYFKGPTKSPVMIPLGAILDLTSRMTLDTPPVHSGNSRDENMSLNAAISREEKDELWGSLPDIYLAVIKLYRVVLERLRENALPLVTDILDQLVRIFTSARTDNRIREHGYHLANELLHLAGPSLLKITVESMLPLAQDCCRDILEEKGFLQANKAPVVPPTQNGTKRKDAGGNADAFLSTQASEAAARTRLGRDHLDAAEKFLPTLFSRVPQKHLSPDTRGLLDRTAILSSNKGAMLASCLHPFKDSNGRYYPSILPFLVRQFPRDQGVEVLRSNLRSTGRYSQDTWYPQEGLEALLKEPPAELAATTVTGPANDAGDEADGAEDTPKSGWAVQDNGDMEVDSAPTDDPFLSISAPAKSAQAAEDIAIEEDSAVAQVVLPVALKRKAEDELSESVSLKRLDKGKAVDVDTSILSKPIKSDPLRNAPPPVEEGDDESDSDSGSIQIDMTLDDDEEDAEEEDE